MRGHWISQTRRLNRHYQSGGQKLPDEYWGSFYTARLGTIGGQYGWFYGIEWQWDNALNRYKLAVDSTRQTFKNINQVAYAQSAYKYRLYDDAYSMTDVLVNEPSPPASPSMDEEETSGHVKTGFVATQPYFGTTGFGSNQPAPWLGFKYIKVHAPIYGYRQVGGVQETFPASLDMFFDKGLLEAETDRILSTYPAQTGQILTIGNVNQRKSDGLWSQGSEWNLFVETSTTSPVRRTNHFTKWIKNGISELLIDVDRNISMRRSLQLFWPTAKYIGWRFFFNEGHTQARDIYYALAPVIYDADMNILSEDGVNTTWSNYSDYHWYVTGSPINCLVPGPRRYTTNVGTIAYKGTGSGNQNTIESGRYRVWQALIADGITKQEFEDARLLADPNLRKWLYVDPT